MDEIRTERLLLRRARLEDAAAMHSIMSDPPPSPFVSIARKEHVAQMFAQKYGGGRVYQFRIRRRDEGFTWNFFFEGETLPVGGTRVRNVVQRPLDPTAKFSNTNIE